MIKCVVFVIAILVSCCYSEVRIGQRVKRDTDKSILHILRALDEKVNRIHTMAVTNRFLPKCTAAIKNANLVAGNKCWKNLVTQVKTVDESSATKIQLLGQLVRDSYDGEESRLPLVATFIKNNVEKGSDIATSGYEALLDAMEDYDHLYLKKIPTDNGLGSGLISYTYRTLIEIRNAEGESSHIFTQTLPAVTNSILSGKEIFIRNNVTGDYMYAPSDDSEKILVGDVKQNDPRYLWKLKPAEKRWDENNQELFYIVNLLENEILTVADGDGSLKLAYATEEKKKSTWSMFYIRLVQGRSGEEVAIQCSYWGIKNLGLHEREAWKMPRLLKTSTLEDLPSGIWLLQPKE